MPRAILLAVLRAQLSRAWFVPVGKTARKRKERSVCPPVHRPTDAPLLGVRRHSVSGLSGRSPPVYLAGVGCPPMPAHAHARGPTRPNSDPSSFLNTAHLTALRQRPSIHPPRRSGTCRPDCSAG